jgi:predicted transcriptional regulator
MISQYENAEELVFNAVQQYLNNNRIMEKNNLVKYIKSYFAKNSVNINEDGIKKNLESLIKKKRIVEGSKLTKQSVLINKKRKIIYGIIISNPGIIFNKIVKISNMANHVVFWHLGMLLKFNHVKKTIVNTREIYYDSKMDEDKAKKLYFTSKKESKNIIDYLKKNNEGVNKATIANDLQIHPKTVNKYLSLLIKYGFVEMEKFSPREKLYFLKPDSLT